MQLLIIGLFLTLSLALATPLSEDQAQFVFTRFVHQFNKSYETQVLLHRYTIFKANLDEMITHNANPNKKWRMGVTQFADLSPLEFTQQYLGGLHLPQKTKLQPCASSNSSVTSSDLKTFPKLDWRSKDVVPAIKNQGSCGSCWAFSAVNSLEVNVAISRGKRLSDGASEQQLIDCTHKNSSTYDNEGCSGGYMATAMQYIQDTGGLCAESEIPYVAKNQACTHKCTPSIPMKSFEVVRPGSDDLYKHLTRGSISIGLAANSRFQHYVNGLFDACEPPRDTGKYELNHAVNVVGFVTESQTKYDAWVVRNSWGTSWGDNGYVYLDATHPNCLGMVVDSAQDGQTVFAVPPSL